MREEAVLRLDLQTPNQAMLLSLQSVLYKESITPACYGKSGEGYESRSTPSRTPCNCKIIYDVNQFLLGIQAKSD